MIASLLQAHSRFTSAIRFLALAAIVSIAAPIATAQAANPAEDFIQNNVQQGLTILNGNGSKEQKREQFRSFLLRLTDLKRIADYTLGPAKNATSPGDLAVFEESFREYAFAVYESEFEKYSGQTLKVTGSQQVKADDWLVHTVLIDPNKPKSSDPITVDFRVLSSGGKLVVGDITVLGLDLAITERDDFSAFLGEHNNDVKALAAELKRRAANVRSGGDLSGK